MHQQLKTYRHHLRNARQTDDRVVARRSLNRARKVAQHTTEKLHSLMMEFDAMGDVDAAVEYDADADEWDQRTRWALECKRWI